MKKLDKNQKNTLVGGVAPAFTIMGIVCGISGVAQSIATIASLAYEIKQHRSQATEITKSYINKGNYGQYNQYWPKNEELITYQNIQENQITIMS